jgi:hypothetical protein
MNSLLTEMERKSFGCCISTCPDEKLAFTKDDGSLYKNLLFINSEAMCKAQNKKTLQEVVKLLDEFCIEHAASRYSGGNNRLRRECQRCWDELKK